MTAGPSLVSTAEAAQRLGVKEQTLRSWRSKGRGPAYVPFGKNTVKYDLRDLDQWVADHKRGGSDV